MDRTEELKALRSELFGVRMKMQLSVKDEKAYAQYKEQLKDVKKRMAKLKYLEQLEKREMEERKIKNGKF